MRNNRWKSESCAGIRDEFHRVVDLCPVELREICGYSRLEEWWEGARKRAKWTLLSRGSCYEVAVSGFMAV